MKNRHKIEIQVEEPIEYTNTGALQLAALAVLELHNLEQDCEVMVVITDDGALRDLNRRFRGIDAPTDVLSFANDNKGPYVGISADFPQQLGDIVISIERAQKQADEVDAKLSQELQLLVVHGTLHLLGYDHETEADKAKMWAVQDQILKILNVDIPLPE